MKKRPYLRFARAAGGLLSVGVLLFLLIAEFLGYGEIEAARLHLLVLVIGALLGVDMVLDNLPLQVEVGSPGEEGDGGSGEGGGGSGDE
jgi:hypothetical protein